MLEETIDLRESLLLIPFAFRSKTLVWPSFKLATFIRKFGSHLDFEL